MQMEKHLLLYYFVQVTVTRQVIYQKNIHTGQHAIKIAYLVLKTGFDWLVWTLFINNPGHWYLVCNDIELVSQLLLFLHAYVFLFHFSSSSDE